MQRGQSLRLLAMAVAALAVALLLGSCQRSTSAGGAPGSKSPPAQAKRITFVELGSVNCIPCKAMQPILEKVRQEFASQVEVVFHDVWTSEGKALCRELPHQGHPDAGLP